MPSKLKTIPLAAALVSLEACAILSAQSEPASEKRCEAPDYFGVCDPFVPGTIIALQGDKKPIRVVSTWFDGPAEKAGVCPGDLIIAANGASAFDSTTEQMLKVITSSSPTPLTLKIKRGSGEMGFEMPRVRESALAEFSKQKFMRPEVDKTHLKTVPLSETRAELEQLDDFEGRAAARNGFTWMEGAMVPSGTREAAFGKLQQLTSRTPQSPRLRGFVSACGGGNYTLGFTVIVLKDPAQIMVNFVYPGSPAHEMGLLPGDELLDANGSNLSSLSENDLKDIFCKADAPRDFNLTAERGDAPLKVTLRAIPIEQLRESYFLGVLPPFVPRSANDYVLGLRALYSDKPREAVVANLDYPSPAFDAGLHEGDLIRSINGTPIEEIDRAQFEKMLSPAQPSPVTIEVSRVGKTLSFKLTPVTYAASQASIGRVMTKSGPVPTDCDTASEKPAAPQASQ